MNIILPLLRLAIYIAVFVGVYAVISYDAIIGFGHEQSLTEIVQEVLLLLMIIVSFVTAQRYHPYRMLHRLLGVVAALSLIREFNNFLGAHFFDGAWQVGVLVILLGTTPYFVRHYRPLFREISEFTSSYACGVLLTGGLLLHVFSRLYGLPQLWQRIMGEDYLRKVARISEESLELLAYAIIFVGICELVQLTVAAPNISNERFRTARLAKA